MFPWGWGRSPRHQPYHIPFETEKHRPSHDSASSDRSQNRKDLAKTYHGETTTSLDCPCATSHVFLPKYLTMRECWDTRGGPADSPPYCPGTSSLCRWESKSASHVEKSDSFIRDFFGLV